MNLSKLMLSFGTLALAIASAASNYHFSILQSSYIGGQELKRSQWFSPVL